jgi:DNA-binding transcriptional ArsR family regulator
VADLSELDQRILDLLGVYQTAAGAWPRLRTLAERLGVSRRHVRRRLAQLETAGYVTRQTTLERGDDPGWAVRGLDSRAPGRQTSNLYRLDHVLGPLGHAEMQKTSSTPRTRPESCPTGKPSTDHLPVEGQGVAHDGGEDGDVLGVDAEVELAAAPAVEPRKVVLDPAQCDTWNHDPTEPELRGVLAAAFGDGAKVEVIPHPTYTTARGRVIDLETCSVDDMHQALDQLERHTCSNGDRCVPCPRHQGPAGASAGCARCQTCKRHSPRRHSR